MKYLIIIILFLLSGNLLFAQDKSLIHKGNELYKQQKYKEAEENYRKSAEKKNQDVTSNFNLGDALYKQKKFADAGEQFNKLASAPRNNRALTAQAYHNLGNSFLENKKLEESIDAYKKALLNNPKDDETRYNLAYAQEKLKQQQQQNKQNQNNKNQDNKNQQNKDNKNQDNKNNKDQNKQNQDKQNQNQDKKDQQNGQQKDKLSKEDAERMLDALNNDEKQTQ
uniref:tetratricopeptide repeat protein n=1 Tax=uncultured Mucilaginibacter sp. TaxID=797541 RepID=UPI0025E4FF02